MSGMNFADLVLQVHSESVAIGEKALESLAVKGDSVEARLNNSLDRVSAGMKNAMSKTASEVQQGMAQVEQKFANTTKVVQGNTQVSQQELDRQAVSAQMAMGNLTAQYNDIAVMMAAGQNPIQLALQQGTQITQVYGQLQAQGLPIMQSMIGALRNMVTPINLITIASIAAAGAFVNWLMSGQDSAKEFEKSIEGTKTAVEEYSKWAEIARRETNDLSAALNAGVGGAGKYAEVMSSLSESMIQNQMQKGLAAFNNELELTNGRMTLLEAKAVAIGQASFDWINFREVFGLSRSDMDAAVVADVQAMRDAYTIANDNKKSLDERITAMETLVTLSGTMANMDGKYDPESREGQIVGYLAEQLNLLKEYRDARNSSADAAAQEMSILQGNTELLRLGVQYGQDSVAYRLRQIEMDRAEYERKARESGDYNQSDLASVMSAYDSQAAAERLVVMNDLWQNIKSSAESYFETVMDRAKYINEQTAELESQASILQATRIFGEDSVVVARMRLQAERDAYSAQLDTQKVVGGTKQAMMDLWDAANGVANVDMSGNIIAATSQTYGWGDAMGYVVSQINAILAGLSSISGGLITSAGNKAQADALKRGASVAEARRAKDSAMMEAEYQQKIDAAMMGGNYGEVAGHVMARASDRRLARESAEIADLEEATREREREEKKAARGGSKAPKGFAKNQLDFELDIKSMEDQAAMLSKMLESGGNWRRELALLEAKQKLLNEAQLKGVKITPELSSKIDDLAEQYVNASDALEVLRARQEWFEQAIQQTRASMQDAFTGLITGAYSFAEAINVVISKLAEMAAERAFNWLWSGNGAGQGDTGILGNLVSSFFGGWRADGGSVSAGKAYIVGEHRPEVFVPETAGRIIPRVEDGSDYVPGQGSMGGQTHQTIIQQVVRIVPSEHYEAVVEGIAGDVADSRINEYNRNLNSRIDQYTQDPKMRG